MVGRKRDGRCVYDPIAKQELIEACLHPGVSVTKLARECGVNANQLSTWVREHQRMMSTAPSGGEVVEVSTSTFVPVKVQSAPVTPEPKLDVELQARLPNGVVIDLRGCELQHVGEVLAVLGRLRCSVSTKS